MESLCSQKLGRFWQGLANSFAKLMAVSLIGLSLLAALVPQSIAAEGDSIQITDLTISPAAGSGGTISASHVVVIKGTFTNNTQDSIDLLELNLVSTPAIQSRTELALLLDDPTSANNLVTSDKSAVLRKINPGVEKEWRITFRGEEILGTDASGVFGLGVQQSSVGDGESTVVTTPWFFNADIKPTNVSFVVPLTTLNTHLANNKVQNLKRDLAEAKRLTDLIVNQSDASISWLQDSALRSWVNQLMAASDSEIPIILSSAIDGLSPATAHMPYGHTDLGALSRANQQEDLLDAIRLTRLSAPDRPLFYTPIDGSANRKTISALNEEGIRTIVSNKYLRGNERETTAAVATSASNPVLVHDLAASSCLANADQSEEAFFKLVTCVKSEIGMMTAESPQSSRSIIVLAPADWNISTERFTTLVAALKDQNWMQLVALDLVAAQEATQNFVSQSSDTADPLTRVTIQQANELRNEADILASLYVDQELASGFDSARILGFSDLWETETSAIRYLAVNLALLNTYLSAVSIEASSRITTPEETSDIPITVVNESDQAVSISIALSSKAKSRFSSEPSDLIQVESGQRITVPVSVTLVGAGVVDVEAYLIAPNGERFGEVEKIQISSAAYSQFARTLVWGAFGLLVLLAISNFVKRRKDRSSLETSAH
jgi:hypothetical protein